jgi:hypothetical protein
LVHPNKKLVDTIYAGADIEQAHYYSYDLECLVNPEPKVAHYETLAKTLGSEA